MIDLQTKLTWIKSMRGHSYLYTPSIPQFFLTHPTFSKILNSKNNCEDPDISADERNYYQEYYSFLESKGYLSSIKKSRLEDLKLDASEAKSILANTDQISFEVTDRCNLNCKYCCYGDLYYGFDKRNEKNLNFKTAQIFLDYILNLFNSNLNKPRNKKIAITFYGGEPLLNIDLIKEITYYIQNQATLKDNHIFTMTTNGLILDEHMDFLVKNDFSLAISIDGNAKHNNYRIRKNGFPSFEKVYSNIIRLRDKYPRYFEDRVTFLSVQTNLNPSDEVVPFFQKSFGKNPSIAKIDERNVRSDKEEIFEKMKPTHSTKQNRSKTNKLGNRKQLINNLTSNDRLRKFAKSSGFVFHKYDQLLYKYPPYIYIRTGTCKPFDKRVFLTVNGKILTCEKVGQDQYLGLVSKSGVEIDFEKVAEHYNHLHKSMSEICNNCYNSKFCSQCLFMLLDHTGQIIRCEDHMTLEEYQVYLNNCISIIEKYPIVYSEILRKKRIP